MTGWLAGLLGALLVAMATMPFARWLRGQQMLDHPGLSRRLHAEPTPRGGGAVIAVVFCALVLWKIQGFESWLQGLSVALFVICVAALGWFEDIRPRPIHWRLVGQFAIGCLVLMALGPIESVAVGSLAVENVGVWTTLGLIAVVWLMNLHNFMDGSDGLAASQGLWAGVGFAVLFAQAGQSTWAWLAGGLAGGCAGFLVWNRPRAAVFMGDTGSLLIGGTVGLFAYQGVANGQISLTVCLMLTSVFVVDATATLVRRVVQGHKWYTPHASHAFQCLIAGGLSHAQLLMLYIGINLFWVLPFVVGGLVFPRFEGWLGAVLYATLLMGWWQVQSKAGMPEKKG